MTECNSIECNSHETHNIYLNLGVSLRATLLSNQQQFRLKKINEIKNYLLMRLKKES